MTPPNDADADCMARLQAGEDRALSELMTRWQQPLIAFLVRYIGHQATAVDLAQETFVRVYEKRDSYRGGQFSSWLFSIAANLAKNHLRWQSRHPSVSLDSEDQDSGLSHQYAAEGRSPGEEAASAELAESIAEAVQALPHDLKTVTLLFEYQDQSCNEIATTLGCTPKAVETRLYRARQILRKKLAHWLE